MICNPYQNHQLINMSDLSSLMKNSISFYYFHSQIISKIKKAIWSSVWLKYRHSSKWHRLPQQQGKSFLKVKFNRVMLIQEIIESCQQALLLFLTFQKYKERSFRMKNFDWHKPVDYRILFLLRRNRS